jgi:hypothetical protein
MNEHAPAIFVALEASSLGAAIRQSTWLYMAANVGHILSLVVFASGIAVIDLRMAGLLAATAPGQILKVFRRVVAIGLAGLLLTGSLLFTAEASHVITNPVFQLKLGLIVLGLLNIAWFEFFAAPKLRDLPPLKALPPEAKIAGIISLGIWFVVAACGRSIAYF